MIREIFELITNWFIVNILNQSVICNSGATHICYSHICYLFKSSIAGKLDFPQLAPENVIASHFRQL